MKRAVTIREIPPTTWGCKPITGYIPSLGTRVIVVVVLLLLLPVVVAAVVVVVNFVLFFFVFQTV